MPKRPPDVLHCRTPSLIAIDNRGSAIRSIVYHRSQATDTLDERISRTTYTALGAVDSQTDARFFTEHSNAANETNNFRYGNSLSGKVVHTISVDAGETETLFDIEGRPCWSADSQDTVMRNDYDLLGRPTTVTEQHQEHIAVTERLIYADTASASSLQNLAVSNGHNILGQLIHHLDPAGVLKTDSFSLSGTPLAQTRQLLADDDVQVNWPAFNRFTELSDIAPIYYRTQWQLDASGTTIAQWDANGNRQRLLYNVSGQLRSSHLQQAEQLSEQMIVSNFEYTAAGQVLEETAGNGVKTVYTFEPETQRLLSIYSRRSSKNGRPTVLQDLHYVYDPVGNILSIGDRAQQTQYFANQKTSAQRDYSYDTLYQLIKASGREDANAAKQTQALPPLKTPLPEAADGQLSAYTREYQYDRGGNLIQIRHTGAHSYTRTIEIANNSNRAAFVRIGADGGSLDKDAQSFDDRGNLLALSSGQRLSWNLRNQLIQATVIDRADGAPNDEEHYRYGSDGMRVSKRTQKKSGFQSDKVIYLPGLELRTQNNGKEVLDVILIGEAGRCQVRALHWEEGKPEQIENDQLRYSVDDQIGSSLIELDSNADKLSEEVYYPYGGTALWSAKSKVEAKYKYVRYSGKERDATGLYYYGYRYYMPWLGRWLNPDPAGTVDGLNLFRMVRNTPITLYDKDGLRPEDSRKEAKKEAIKKARKGIFKAYSTLQDINDSAQNLETHLTSSGGVIAAKALANMSRDFAVIAAGVGISAATALVGTATGVALGATGLAASKALEVVGEAAQGAATEKGLDWVANIVLNYDLSTKIHNPAAKAERADQENVAWRERHSDAAKVYDAFGGEATFKSAAKFGEKIIDMKLGSHSIPFGLKNIVAVSDHRNFVVKNIENAEQLIYNKPGVSNNIMADMGGILRQVDALEASALALFDKLPAFEHLVAGIKNKQVNPFRLGLVERLSTKQLPAREEIMKLAQETRNSLGSLWHQARNIAYPALKYRSAPPKAA